VSTRQNTHKIRPRIHLLVVEDDEVDRIALQRELARHPEYDFAVTEAATGREGLQHAFTGSPDCVLLDYHLPDLDGLEFLRELRGESAEMPFPVVMLTGSDNVSVAVEAMKRGARDYLVKDTQRQYLQLLPAVIERILREQRMLSEHERAERQRREAEAKYRKLVEQIPATVYIAALDVPGNLIYISPQVEALGFTAEEWLADPDGLLKRVHPEDRERRLAALAHSYESGEQLRRECRLLTRSGEVRWFLDEASVVRDELGKPLFLQGVLIDITEEKKVQTELEMHRRRLEELVTQRTTQLEKQADLLKDANHRLINEIAERRQTEHSLRESESRFRLLLDSTDEGIYGLDTAGRCTFINDAALRMTGYRREEMLGHDIHSRIHHTRADGSPYPAEECAIYESFRVGKSVRSATEVLWRKDGRALTAEYSAQPLREGEDITGAVLVFRDVTQAQALAQRLSYQATHDALTSLINRQEFERRLNRVLETARHEQVESALCYLDLDQFKIVNDTCGHAAGDELLRQLSARLQQGLRERDTLARLGGDEFGLLLEHCPPDQAIRIANELRESVQNFRFPWDRHTFSVGASIGVVALTAATESTAAALSAADAACYLAKEKGRNRVQVYEADDSEMQTHRGQMQWVTRLTRALDANRFELWFQPITHLHPEGSERAHYEILLRLRDEDGRLVGPEAFLPAAERYSLMPLIDRWVLREAISSYAARYHGLPVERRPLYAVNLSGGSLRDPKLAPYIADLLASHHVAADALCIEITETVAVANLPRAAQFMRTLKELGCVFSLDDFGSGMSSFTYLRNLPVDYLKIDGSFIRSIADDNICRAMAEAINRVAHVMAIETVAEWAESDAVLALLKQLHIDHAQGYAIKNPRPLAELDSPEPHPEGQRQAARQ
jgi:diguanylate cyclase (GGDEF)-like protein/PAS domain S-box-containing protein